MAKVRTRVKRSFFLVLALCALALLLELNRFLPGTWPGGGRGGFQSASVVGGGEPRPDRPREPDRPDPTAVTPPEAPPEQWPPPDGLLIELRGPDGTSETRWRLGAGDGGRADVEPDSKGVVRSQDAKLLTAGFQVRTSAGLVRHVQGLQDPAAKWVVHVPSAKLPRQRPPGRAACVWWTARRTSRSKAPPSAGSTASATRKRRPTPRARRS